MSRIIPSLFTVTVCLTTRYHNNEGYTQLIQLNCLSFLGLVYGNSDGCEWHMPEIGHNALRPFKSTQFPKTLTETTFPALTTEARYNTILTAMWIIRELAELSLFSVDTPSENSAQDFKTSIILRKSALERFNDIDLFRPHTRSLFSQQDLGKKRGSDDIHAAQKRPKRT